MCVLLRKAVIATERSNRITAQPPAEASIPGGLETFNTLQILEEIYKNNVERSKKADRRHTQHEQQRKHLTNRVC